MSDALAAALAASLAAPRVVRAPEFPTGLDWLPAGGPAPTLAALRGRVVLLDFWTFGCINCLHLAPELRALERRFGGRLAMIGVHSGKSIAERETARIAHAAARLDLHHPIVNDRQLRVWRAWAVRAWPTVALVDARGYVAVTRAGELTADLLAPLVARLLAEAEAEPEAAALPTPPPPATPVRPAGALRYPGKVAVSPPDARGVRRLAIADTGHHRVLVGRLDAGGTRLTVERVVGRDGDASRPPTAPGATRAELSARADGPADRARLAGPQGVAFGTGAHAGTLFVADAGHHAVRAVSLATGAVRTLAGTGARVRTAADRAAGALASPWDLAYAEVDGRPTLAVAMAGTHQLWIVDPETGAASPHAGGRGEDLQDGPLRDALLAQPMGIATDGRTLWFADAESSAVRAADADPNGAVRTLAGTGLFDFGHRDGTGDDARLQHPQGIAHLADGRLLVADSYNDALRWVDPHTRRVTTWQRGLREPGGVAVAGGRAWVADTNAHRVLVLALATGHGGELEIG